MPHFFNFFLWRNENLNLCSINNGFIYKPYINVAHVLFKFSLQTQTKKVAQCDLYVSLRDSDRLQVSETIFSYVTWQANPLSFSRETKSFDPIFKKFRKMLPPV